MLGLDDTIEEFINMEEYPDYDALCLNGYDFSLGCDDTNNDNGLSSNKIIVEHIKSGNATEVQKTNFCAAIVNELNDQNFFTNDLGNAKFKRMYKLLESIRLSVDVNTNFKSFKEWGVTDLMNWDVDRNAKIFKLENAVGIFFDFEGVVNSDYSINKNGLQAKLNNSYVKFTKWLKVVADCAKDNSCAKPKFSYGKVLKGLCDLIPSYPKLVEAFLEAELQNEQGFKENIKKVLDVVNINNKLDASDNNTKTKMENFGKIAQICISKKDDNFKQELSKLFQNCYDEINGTGVNSKNRLFNILNALDLGNFISFDSNDFKACGGVSNILNALEIKIADLADNNKKNRFKNIYTVLKETSLLNTSPFKEKIQTLKENLKINENTSENDVKKIAEFAKDCGFDDNVLDVGSGWKIDKNTNVQVAVNILKFYKEFAGENDDKYKSKVKDLMDATFNDADINSPDTIEIAVIALKIQESMGIKWNNAYNFLLDGTIFSSDSGILNSHAYVADAIAVLNQAGKLNGIKFNKHLKLTLSPDNSKYVTTILKGIKYFNDKTKVNIDTCISAVTDLLKIDESSTDNDIAYAKKALEVLNSAGFLNKIPDYTGKIKISQGNDTDCKRVKNILKLLKTYNPTEQEKQAIEKLITDNISDEQALKKVIGVFKDSGCPLPECVKELLKISADTDVDKVANLLKVITEDPQYGANYNNEMKEISKHVSETIKGDETQEQQNIKKKALNIILKAYKDQNYIKQQIKEHEPQKMDTNNGTTNDEAMKKNIVMYKILDGFNNNKVKTKCEKIRKELKEYIKNADTEEKIERAQKIANALGGEFKDSFNTRLGEIINDEQSLKNKSTFNHADKARERLLAVVKLVPTKRPDIVNKIKADDKKDLKNSENKTAVAVLHIAKTAGASDNEIKEILGKIVSGKQSKDIAKLVETINDNSDVSNELKSVVNNAIGQYIKSVEKLKIDDLNAGDADKRIENKIKQCLKEVEDNKGKDDAVSKAASQGAIATLNDTLDKINNIQAQKKCKVAISAFNLIKKDATGNTSLDASLDKAKTILSKEIQALSGQPIDGENNFVKPLKQMKSDKLELDDKFVRDEIKKLIETKIGNDNLLQTIENAVKCYTTLKKEDIIKPGVPKNGDEEDVLRKLLCDKVKASVAAIKNNAKNTISLLDLLKAHQMLNSSSGDKKKPCDLFKSFVTQIESDINEVIDENKNVLNRLNNFQNECSSFASSCTNNGSKEFVQKVLGKDESEGIMKMIKDLNDKTANITTQNTNWKNNLLGKIKGAEGGFAENDITGVYGDYNAKKNDLIIDINDPTKGVTKDGADNFLFDVNVSIIDKVKSVIKEDLDKDNGKLVDKHIAYFNKCVTLGRSNGKKINDANDNTALESEIKKIAWIIIDIVKLKLNTAVKDKQTAKETVAQVKVLDKLDSASKNNNAIKDLAKKIITDAGQELANFINDADDVTQGVEAAIETLNEFTALNGVGSDYNSNKDLQEASMKIFNAAKQKLSTAVQDEQTAQNTVEEVKKLANLPGAKVEAEGEGEGEAEGEEDENSLPAQIKNLEKDIVKNAVDKLKQDITDADTVNAIQPKVQNAIKVIKELAELPSKDKADFKTIICNYCKQIVVATGNKVTTYLNNADDVKEVVKAVKEINNLNGICDYNIDADYTALINKIISTVGNYINNTDAAGAASATKIVGELLPLKDKCGGNLLNFAKTIIDKAVSGMDAADAGQIEQLKSQLTGYYQEKAEDLKTYFDDKVKGLLTDVFDGYKEDVKNGNIEAAMNKFYLYKKYVVQTEGTYDYQASELSSENYLNAIALIVSEIVTNVDSVQECALNTSLSSCSAENIFEKVIKPLTEFAKISSIDDNQKLIKKDYIDYVVARIFTKFDNAIKDISNITDLANNLEQMKILTTKMKDRFGDEESQNKIQSFYDNSVALKNFNDKCIENLTGAVAGNNGGDGVVKVNVGLLKKVNSAENVVKLLLDSAGNILENANSKAPVETSKAIGTFFSEFNTLSANKEEFLNAYTDKVLSFLEKIKDNLTDAFGSDLVPALNKLKEIKSYLRPDNYKNDAIDDDIKEIADIIVGNIISGLESEKDLDKRAKKLNQLYKALSEEGAVTDKMREDKYIEHAEKIIQELEQEFANLPPNNFATLVNNVVGSLIDGMPGSVQGEVNDEVKKILDEILKDIGEDKEKLANFDKLLAENITSIDNATKNALLETIKKQVDTLIGEPEPDLHEIKNLLKTDFKNTPTIEAYLTSKLQNILADPSKLNDALALLDDKNNTDLTNQQKANVISRLKQDLQNKNDPEELTNEVVKYKGKVNELYRTALQQIKNVVDNSNDVQTLNDVYSKCKEKGIQEGQQAVLDKIKKDINTISDIQQFNQYFNDLSPELQVEKKVKDELLNKLKQFVSNSSNPEALQQMYSGLDDGLKNAIGTAVVDKLFADRFVDMAREDISSIDYAKSSNVIAKDIVQKLKKVINGVQKFQGVDNKFVTDVLGEYKDLLTTMSEDLELGVNIDPASVSTMASSVNAMINAINKPENLNRFSQEILDQKLALLKQSPFVDLNQVSALEQSDEQSNDKKIKMADDIIAQSYSALLANVAKISDTVEIDTDDLNAINDFTDIGKYKKANENGENLLETIKASINRIGSDPSLLELLQNNIAIKNVDNLSSATLSAFDKSIRDIVNEVNSVALARVNKLKESTDGFEDINITPLKNLSSASLRNLKNELDKIKQKVADKYSDINQKFNDNQDLQDVENDENLSKMKLQIDKQLKRRDLNLSDSMISNLLKQEDSVNKIGKVASDKKKKKEEEQKKKEEQRQKKEEERKKKEEKIEKEKKEKEEKEKQRKEKETMKRADKAEEYKLNSEYTKAKDEFEEAKKEPEPQANFFLLVLLYIFLYFPGYFYSNSIDDKKKEYNDKINDLKNKMNGAKSAYEQKKQDNSMKYALPNSFKKKISAKGRRQLQHKTPTYDKILLNDLFTDKRNRQ